MRRKVRILDTTLRDGFQSSGIPALDTNAVMSIAHILKMLNVDEVEAVFRFLLTRTATLCE